MNYFARIFASAVVRKVAFVAVAAFFTVLSQCAKADGVVLHVTCAFVGGQCSASSPGELCEVFWSGARPSDPGGRSCSASMSTETTGTLTYQHDNPFGGDRPPATGSTPISGFACGSAFDSWGGACVTKCVSPQVRNQSTGVCGAPPTCPTGSHLVNGSCVANTCQAGSTDHRGENGESGLDDGNACIDGCEYPMVNLVCMTTSLPGDPAGCVGTVKLGSGNACSTGTTTITSMQKKCMQQGKTFGTVNGIEVCLPAGTPGTPPIKTSGDTTTTTGGTNGSGESTGDTDVKKSSSTSFSNGTATTTTTISTTSGNPPTTTTQTETTSEPVDSYCARNPNEKGCKNTDSSASGGDECSSPPEAEGDPISAAILRQTWEARCSTYKESLNNVYAQFKTMLETGVDPLKNPLSESERETKNFGSFNHTDILGGGSCPQPYVVNVLGKSIDIKFDFFCNLAEILGHIVVIAASMVAFRMVIGAA